MEIAQRLLAQQESVPLLFILDHAGPAAKVRWTEWIRWHCICLSQLEPRDRPRYLIDGLGFKIRSSHRLPVFIRRIAAGALSKGGGKAKANIRIRQLQSSLNALHSYRIAPYPGKMVIARGKESHARMHCDPWSGWRQVAMGDIEVLDIPGHHMNMLQEPHVGVLAEKMTELMTAGLAAKYGSA
jgi:thioesterase domain-containing protein